MATIITKFSSTSSAVPTASDLVQGELAVNTADKRLFTEDSGATIIEIGTNPSSITTGAITASGTVTSSSGFSGNLTGNVTGDVTGNITGDVTGDVTGSISGGTVAGSTGTFSSNVTASGTLGVTGATTLSDNLTMSDGRLQITNSSFNLKTFELTGSANTTSSAVYLSANNLTTGKALEVVSFSADSSSRSLVRLANTSGVATGTTVLQIDQSSSGNALSVSGDSLFTGDITVTGNATISGNLTFGDADTDSISLNADVDSHILPNTDDTYDLGSTSKQWRNLYINGAANIDSLVADTADINGGTVDNTAIGSTTASTGNFSTLSINGTAITATAAELNVLDGITATVTELNYTDGVTSNIQTQLDTKAPLASPTFTGTVTIPDATVTGDVSFGDNDKATFGAGNDLEIYSDGANAIIDHANTGAGALFIKGDNNVIITNQAGTENKAVFASNGAVTLYYDNAAKLATTSTGIDVTGTATADYLTTQSTTPSLHFMESDTTNLNTRLRVASSDFQVHTIDDSYSSAKTRLLISNTTGDISFYEDTGTTAKFFWDASAESLGIGTTSPDKRLDVLSGTSNSDVAAFSGTATGRGLVISTFDDTGTNADAMVDFDAISSAGQLSFSTSTSERLRIDSTGNVGIGTTSPSSDLHIASSLATIRLEDSDIAGGAAYSLITGSSAGNIAFSADPDNVRSSSDIRFNIDGSEAMRIDSSGNLLVGKTAASGSTQGAELRADGRLLAVSTSDFAGYFNRKTTDGEIVRFVKDTTTVGSIAASGGALQVSGNTNSGLQFNSSAFVPMQNGATIDATIDLGSSVRRFQDIYATNGTIQTSDRNEKQDIEALSDAEQRVAVACKGLLRKFRWKSAVEEKGDEARIHFGIIAQDLQAAFEAEGLDAGRYAMFIHSTWTDEETGEERSRMGVRYSELLAFIIAAI
jgi:hypothetical protein